MRSPTYNLSPRPLPPPLTAIVPATARPPRRTASLIEPEIEVDERRALGEISSREISPVSLSNSVGRNCCSRGVQPREKEIVIYTSPLSARTINPLALGARANVRVDESYPSRLWCPLYSQIITHFSFRNFRNEFQPRVDQRATDWSSFFPAASTTESISFSTGRLE